MTESYKEALKHAEEIMKKQVSVENLEQLGFDTKFIDEGGGTGCYPHKHCDFIVVCNYWGVYKLKMEGTYCAAYARLSGLKDEYVLADFNPSNKIMYEEHETPIEKIFDIMSNEEIKQTILEWIKGARIYFEEEINMLTNMYNSVNSIDVHHSINKK